MVFKMRADSYQDVGTVTTASASRAKPNFAQRRSSDVKRCTGQTGQLQAGLAIVDATTHGAEIQTALNTEIRSDRDMEACLNGLALCWQHVEESNNQPKLHRLLHRLHLVLTDAPKYNPRHGDHPAHLGGGAIGLLWGYALDGEVKPAWEVQLKMDASSGGGQHLLTSRRAVVHTDSGHYTECMDIMSSACTPILLTPGILM